MRIHAEASRAGLPAKAAAEARQQGLVSQARAGVEWPTLTNATPPAKVSAVVIAAAGCGGRRMPDADDCDAAREG